MGFRLGRFGAAIIAATLLLAASPASAKPAESHDDSLYSQFESLTSRLKADSARALDAAGAATARAIEASKGAIAEIQTDAGPRLETFRQTLNEQKAKLATIGDGRGCALRRVEAGGHEILVRDVVRHVDRVLGAILGRTLGLRSTARPPRPSTGSATGSPCSPIAKRRLKPPFRPPAKIERPEMTDTPKNRPDRQRVGRPAARSRHAGRPARQLA